MADRPIIFSAPMVRALLDGRKSQTRRVAFRDAGFGVQAYASEEVDSLQVLGWRLDPEGPGYRAFKPTVWAKLKPGDRLWVRETFTIETDFNVGYKPPFSDGRPIKWTDNGPEYGLYWEQPHYRATDPAPELVVDGVDGPGCRWRSPRYMPRWASRLTLTVTDVRVQRLQEISEADAIAEGAMRNITCKSSVSGTTVAGDTWFYDEGPDGRHFEAPNPRDAYEILWGKLHGWKSWDANPFVAAISFTTEQRNIDHAG